MNEPTTQELMYLAEWALNRQWQPSGVPSDYRDDDLASAYEGAAKALITWDPEKGSFSTHLLWCVKGAVSRDRVRRNPGGRWNWDATKRGEGVPWPLSFETGDGEFTIGEKVADTLTDQDGESWWTADLDGLLAALTERERVMVTMTQRQAAEVLGIKQASVGRARVRIYARLRAQFAAAS